MLPGILKPKEILAVTLAGEKCPGLESLWTSGGFQKRQTRTILLGSIETLVHRGHPYQHHQKAMNSCPQTPALQLLEISARGWQEAHH